MAATIVGVDVGGTSIRAVRFDGDLVAVASSAGPTPRGADAIATAVASHVREVGAGATAVAVGMPGRVDAATGVVSSAVNLGIEGPVTFAALVAEQTGLPVHVENDVNAAALGAFAHLRLGPGTSLAYVNVGTGIAAGFVLGGRLWRGATGAAGEIGHIPMWSHGPACPCGQAGCAEAVASGRAVTADPARRRDVAVTVAWTVQLCVMTLDVDVVALGGGMTESAEVVAEVRDALARHEASSPMLADLELGSRVRVVPPDAPLGSLGAALALAGGGGVVTLTVGGGTVVGPDGALVVDDGVIVASGARGAVDIDAAGGWIVPGFIDLQINGAHGIDVTTQPQRIGELAAVLPRYGVTAFLPTVITCPPAVSAAALAAWSVRTDGPGAVPLGLHLEGPMLSAVRAGAHPAEHLVAPGPAVIAGWSSAAGVALVTVAPELPGAADVIEALASRGVVVSVGHTDCSAAEFARARDSGARYVTHLFNAMRPFGHRDPGPIGAALADDTVVAGLICDGVHVDPVAVRMAWHALGPRRLNLVTDAVAALGADHGRLGTDDVMVAGGEVRNAAGVLAGSALTLDQAVRNLVTYTGCTVPDAIATVTSTPADLLGRADRGRLTVGGRADITVLDRGLGVLATIVGGEVGVEVVIVATPADAAVVVAGVVARALATLPSPVIGLATGSSPLGAYGELIERHRRGEVTFATADAVLLDEYLGLRPGHPEAYRAFIRRELTDHVDLAPARLHGPDVDCADVPALCARYEALLADLGGVDVQLLGIGSDGHIGFNEPGSSLCSRTRIKTLTEGTRADNARFFGSLADVPRHVVTQGLATIGLARHVVLVATGAGKAGPIARAVEGPLTAMCPASVLQLHPHATIVVDEAAAAGLAHAGYYRDVYAGKPDWQPLWSDSPRERVFERARQIVERANHRARSSAQWCTAEDARSSHGVRVHQ